MPPAKKIEFRLEGECHVCISHARTKDGYPVKRRGGNGPLTYLSHLIYEEHHGQIPTGVVVRHTCDNPPCINPAHLVAGTQAMNLQDMTDRRRRYAKLSDADVLAILDSTEHPAVLAAQYGISRSHADNIQNGRVRKKLTKRRAS